MKKLTSKILCLGICGAIASQTSFAASSFNTVKPFVGLEIGTTNNFYDDSYIENTANAYGFYNTKLSSSILSSLLYGANVGVRFLDDSHIYHPGAQLYYKKIKDSATLSVPVPPYGDMKFDIDANYTLTGFSFDNYIRVMHDAPNAQEIQYDMFVVLGLEAGNIKSNYKSADFTLMQMNEKGSFYGAKVEGLWEFSNGLGYNFNISFLKADIDASPYILTFKMGLRYTF